MADTKVSGLTAAGSLLTTHEFPVNEAGTSKKVTGAQILAKTAQGNLGYAQVTANQGTFTAQTDLTGLTVTITAAQANGRRIRITGSCWFNSSVGTDYAALLILEGATQLQSTQVNAQTSPVAAMGVVIIQPTNASHTYKLAGIRAAGTGNITMWGAATSPAFILVEDIGT